MKSRHQVRSCFWLPIPLEQVWNFSSDPKNISKISPPFYGLKANASAQLANDARFGLHFSPAGIPLPIKWVSKVIEFNPTGPQRLYTEVQESGPFKFWRHEHSFEEGFSEVESAESGKSIKMREGGTWIRDTIDFQLPWGLIGNMAHDLFIRASLGSLLAYRRKKTWEYLISPSSLASSASSLA